MVRVKRGNVARNRRKKILKFAKGFKGAHSRLFCSANAQVMKALFYSYTGRKKRKKVFKKLWICRVNAALRDDSFTYSYLKYLLKNSCVQLNLKILAQLVAVEKDTFYEIVEAVNINKEIIFDLTNRKVMHSFPPNDFNSILKGI
jgi:large subunit ribosomal protein L20